uniref:Uncharacterized protein n=1 Tax=Panagrolaimus sp. PS1159 TaxID=55785 RepID=A0AC35GAX6_9BILA
MIEHPLRDIVTWYQILHFTTIFVVISLVGCSFLLGCIFVGLLSCSAYSPCQQYRIRQLQKQREVIPYYRAIPSYQV